MARILQAQGVEMALEVFIVGLDDFHLPLLEALPVARECRFHPLLTKADLRDAARISLTELLDRARRQMDAFGGSVDAVCTYWDFPASCLAPILAAERGLPTPPLDAVVRCEHKYWSRVEQQRVVPDCVPRFCAVDPFAPDAADRIDLDFPFWLKPVKSFNSYLGFRIDDRAGLMRALSRTRDEIHRIARPFDRVLERVDLPPEIADVGGSHCIAEAIISKGRQCTVEGYGFEGEIHLFGTIDSHRFAGRSTFSGYEYPSTLPEEVTRRMAEITEAVMRRIGYDGGAFNVEFFWDEEQDHLWLLEINSRVSQSHSALFASVDGQANHAVTIDLALGRTPHFPHRGGPFPRAAKFFVRTFQDGVLERVPTADEIARIEGDFPGSRIKLLLPAGVRLSDTPHQESYSYELAWVYTAGRTGEELARNFERIEERLNLHVESEARRASA